MLTDPEIAGMRATSVIALPDTCRVTRVIEDPILDGLVLQPGDTETIYEGPCRVRAREAQEQNVQAGDLHETLGRYVATLPALASAATDGSPNDVNVDDFLTVLTSTDTAMVGRSFQVVHVGWSAWQIDRRIGLQDQQQPPGVEA